MMWYGVPLEAVSSLREFVDDLRSMCDNSVVLQKLTMKWAPNFIDFIARVT